MIASYYWIIILLQCLLTCIAYIYIRKSSSIGEPSPPSARLGKNRPFHVRMMHLAFHFITSFSFVKLCVRRTIYLIKVTLNRSSYAKQGNFAPEASVVSLDGQILSLKDDYFKKYYDIPLIINMGSYS